MLYGMPKKGVPVHVPGAVVFRTWSFCVGNETTSWAGGAPTPFCAFKYACVFFLRRRCSCRDVRRYTFKCSDFSQSNNFTAPLLTALTIALCTRQLAWLAAFLCCTRFAKQNGKREFTGQASQYFTKTHKPTHKPHPPTNHTSHKPTLFHLLKSLQFMPFSEFVVTATPNLYLTLYPHKGQLLA